jgi:hypothetical protein
LYRQRDLSMNSDILVVQRRSFPDRPLLYRVPVCTELDECVPDILSTGVYGRDPYSVRSIMTSRDHDDSDDSDDGPVL